MLFSQGPFKFLCQREGTETSIMHVCNHTLYFELIYCPASKAAFLWSKWSRQRWNLGTRFQVRISPRLKVRSYKGHSHKDKGRPHGWSVTRGSSGCGRAGSICVLKTWAPQWVFRGCEEQSAGSCARVRDAARVLLSAQEEQGRNRWKKLLQEESRALHKWMVMIISNTGNVMVSLSQGMHYPQCILCIISVNYSKVACLSEKSNES